MGKKWVGKKASLLGEFTYWMPPKPCMSYSITKVFLISFAIFHQEKEIKIAECLVETDSMCS